MLLSPNKASRLLGISDRRLRQPDMDARLQPVKVGRTRAYREDAVSAELNRRIEAALEKVKR